MLYKVNKKKCIGCQICIANCPGATRMGKDGKAEVIDQEKLKRCGGESICPVGAIEKINEEGETEQPEQQTTAYEPGFGKGLGQGRGLGRGMGKGLGRGMGRGLGRGMGKGLGRGLQNERGGGRGKRIIN